MRSFTKEELEAAVRQSKSWDNVYRILGCKGRPRIRRLCLDYEIDVSHFTGQGWNNGNHETKIGIEVYLSNQKPTKSINLKRRLFNAGLKSKVCEVCNRTEWNGQEIPLELHHINGNSEDNVISNLQIVCPNCHALTENYRGANQERIKYRKAVSLEEWKVAIESTYNRAQACIKLGIAPYGGNYKTIDKIIKEYQFKFLSPVCQPSKQIDEVKITYTDHKGETKEIAGKKRSRNKYPAGFNWRKQPHPWARKVQRPSKEELEKLVWEKPILQLSKEYGVTDNAVRKWCELYGIINLPPLRYWPRRRSGWTHEEALEEIRPKQPIKRFTDEQVKAILTLLVSRDLNQREIAKKYGVSHSVIVALKQNKTYRHISKEYHPVEPAPASNHEPLNWWDHGASALRFSP